MHDTIRDALRASAQGTIREDFLDEATEYLATRGVDSAAIIADAYVEREFGTGCLKVTPAHDMNDFELGRKHGLEAIAVQDEAGRINDNAPEKYRGMDRTVARKAVVEDLKDLTLLDDIRDYEHNVGECYRCHTIVEPYLSEQWFVRTRTLADAGVAGLRIGGNFRWDNLDSFIHLLERGFPVRAERLPDRIVLHSL